MITDFILSDFKSYKKGQLPLGTLTLLIGANAAGKSNLIEALRLLCWLAQGQKLSNIQYAVNQGDQVIRGRVDDLCYKGTSKFTLGCRVNSTQWNQLALTLDCRQGELHISHEQIFTTNKILYELNQASEAERTDVIIAYNNFTKGKNKPQILCSDQMAVFTQLNTPAQFNSKYEKSQKIIPETVQEYQKVLQNILFLDPIPAKMREYSFKSDKQLRGDGGNLSSVLWWLWQNQPQNQEVILNFIRSVPEQDIIGLDFIDGPRGEVMVRLQETFGNSHHFYDAGLLSDGTLRVLAMAAALLSANKGSLVVIEEIDNGIHPSRADHLLTTLQQIAKDRQLRVLLSTHNPALMDALPDEVLGDVVFCYREPTAGDSRLIRLGDLENFPSLILQGKLGQLVTSGIVNRFVKSPQTVEERKQKAMAWLERLREYGNE